MPVLDLNSILLVILTLSVIFFLFAMVYMVYKLYLVDSKLETDVIEGEAHKKALMEVQKAHEHSLRLIANANDAVLHIINSAEYLSEDAKHSLLDNFKSSLQDEIQKSTQEIQKSTSYIRDILDKEVEKSGEIVSSVSHEFQQFARKEEQALQSELRKITEDYKTSVQSHLASQLKKIDEETESYKQVRIHEIERKLPKFIMDVTTSVLGQSYTTSQQEDAIKTAISNAKSEGFFN